MSSNPEPSKCQAEFVCQHYAHVWHEGNALKLPPAFTPMSSRTVTLPYLPTRHVMSRRRQHIHIFTSPSISPTIASSFWPNLRSLRTVRSLIDFQARTRSFLLPQAHSHLYPTSFYDRRPSRSRAHTSIVGAHKSLLSASLKNERVACACVYEYHHIVCDDSLCRCANFGLRTFLRPVPGTLFFTHSAPHSICICIMYSGRVEWLRGTCEGGSE